MDKHGYQAIFTLVYDTDVDDDFVVLTNNCIALYCRQY